MGNYTLGATHIYIVMHFSLVSKLGMKDMTGAIYLKSPSVSNIEHEY